MTGKWKLKISRLIQPDFLSPHTALSIHTSPWKDPDTTRLRSTLRALLLPLPNLLLPHRIKYTQIQRDLIAQPRRPLRVVAQLRLRLEGVGPLGDRVRVDQRRQRAPPDDQPGDEGAELRGREEVYLEHGVRVGADWFFPEAVDPELGDWMVVSNLLISDYTFP